MGNGSDVTIDAAEPVLKDDNLRRIQAAIKEICTTGRQPDAIPMVPLLCDASGGGSDTAFGAGAGAAGGLGFELTRQQRLLNFVYCSSSDLAHGFRLILPPTRPSTLRHRAQPQLDLVRYLVQHRRPDLAGGHGFLIGLPSSASRFSRRRG